MRRKRKTRRSGEGRLGRGREEEEKRTSTEK